MSAAFREVFQSSLVVFLQSYPLSQVVLETEYDNRASLSLYGSMGFIKDRRLYRFYLNGKDASVSRAGVEAMLIDGYYPSLQLSARVSNLEAG